MKKVALKKGDPFFMTEAPVGEITFGREDYEMRQGLLMERMKAANLDFVLVHGDREHFSNVMYLTGMDCRFEDILLCYDKSGKLSVMVGNEGISQTLLIQVPFTYYLYQNFSLQGQPRGQQKPLREILKTIGIEKSSKVGVICFRYFEEGDLSPGVDVTRSYDLPAFILEEIYGVAAKENVTNFTRAMTGYPGGIRTCLRSTKEIAFAENAGNRAGNIVVRMIKALKEGVSENEVATAALAGLQPVTMHPIINFGPQKVAIGVTGPTERKLNLGEVCGVCYGTRGSLVSRVSIAAKGADTVAPELREHLDFYKDFWRALTNWLEHAKVGASQGMLYDCVMDLIGDPKYGIALNPTHSTSLDEWTNSASFKNSPYVIEDGAHIQVDIIASRKDPVISAICEDTVVIASEKLRAALKQDYPAVYERIVARQEKARTVLGVDLPDDVLPMCNLNTVYFPYLLDTNTIFGLE